MADLYLDKAARQAFQLLEALTGAIKKNSDFVELARTDSGGERIVDVRYPL